MMKIPLPAAVSATGRIPPDLGRLKSPRGFTLVEILVVIVIVSIMTGLAVISIGGNSQRELQQEALRLQLVLRTAADEALLQGREYGLIAEHNRYQIVQFDSSERQWVADDSRIFAAYTLPDNISLNLSLEGEPVDLAEILAPDREEVLTGESATETDSRGDDPDKEAAGIQEPPALIFFSSGEATPFVMEIGNNTNNSSYEISSDGIQDIQIEQHNG